MTSDSRVKNDGLRGDDLILDCCMYFQSMTQKKITLLSNDRNLCIKVMVHDIDSISAESKPKMEEFLNQIGQKVPINMKKEIIIQEDHVSLQTFILFSL